MGAPPTPGSGAGGAGKGTGNGAGAGRSGGSSSASTASGPACGAALRRSRLPMRRPANLREFAPGEGLAEGGCHAATRMSSTDVSGRLPATAATPTRSARASEPFAGPPVA